LAAAPQVLSYAFVVSMMAWMLVVRPAGWLADRLGRRPLLLAGWATMTVRLILLALAREPWQVDRKSTRLNSSHRTNSYAVFCSTPRPLSSTLFPYTTLFRSILPPRRKSSLTPSS